MFLSKAIVLAALLTLLAVNVDSSFGGGGGSSYNFDLSNASDLRELYNSKVYEADRMKRPLDGSTFQLGPLSHSGVRVTLEDGTKWFVHKGRGFGLSSQTVVVNARHISSDWNIIETKNFGGCKTVSDFVKAGGSDYSLLFDNCHMGANRIWKQCAEPSDPMFY